MEQLNPNDEYDRLIDRYATIDAILALDKRFTRDYLNTLSLNDLHNLEDSLLDTLHSS